MTDDDSKREPAAGLPADREARIAELERELEALRRQEDEGENTKVAEEPITPSGADRIAALEARLEEVLDKHADQRPTIQVIQRTEAGEDKKNEKSPPTASDRDFETGWKVVGWGCAVAMFLWLGWCVYVIETVS